uniref:Hexosyltransferase n=1 Tax=Chlamydomonas leiostraca TaxID=1034604 RepID=A0A7S0R5E2_9CHLO|mmetsp:Transcript_14382/g.35655  ORF Transcript_14382/g.35655 Transcript_14382/m.35655 type:complete len:381 (+) Transcript_14382:153-1295(+)
MQLSMSGALLVLVLWCGLGAVKAVEQLQLKAAEHPIAFTGSKLCTSDILVIVIASQKRDTWKLQADTWLQHFPHYIATEQHTPKCKMCGSPEVTPHKGSLFEGALYFGDRFHHRPLDWYCAQQRPMQALARVLAQAQARASLPKWLVIIDDDTALHPWNALKMMAAAQPSTAASGLDKPILYGSEYRGGAGFIFNRAALQNLSNPIPVVDMSWDRQLLQWTEQQGGSMVTGMDACVHRLMGGSWCYMHSDHVMGLCAKSANIQVLDRNGTMAQWCPVGTMLLDPKAVGGRVNNLRDATKADTKTQSWLTDHMVSCHYMDKTAMDSIYDMIKGTWAPASPSGQQGAAPSTQEAASSSGQAAPSGAQPAKQARRLAGSSRGR